jgi:hypothetical protein
MEARLLLAVRTIGTDRIKVRIDGRERERCMDALMDGLMDEMYS